MSLAPKTGQPDEDPEIYSGIPPECLPNVDDLVTEDDTPVDNIFSEKQQRLLTEPLHSSWKEQRFVAFANVGLFFTTYNPPLVPDALLSVDVKLPSNVFVKHHRSYFVWEYGKPPDVVIEVVSNKESHEADTKLIDYARIGVKYYAIFDPEQLLGKQPLRVYELHGMEYVEMARAWFPVLALGLRLWEGRYEDLSATWLRWHAEDGELIATGAERAVTAEQTAEQERKRADQEQQRAEQEQQRAEQLAARLRALGVDPDAADG